MTSAGRGRTTDPAPDLRVVVCAREAVADLPEGVCAITADDILG